MKNIPLSFLLAAVTLLGAGSFATGASADSMHGTASSTGENIMTTANGTTSSTTTVSVMVMKHVCNPTIKNLQDFENLEAGKAPIAALANTVLNCPTTGLPGNEAVAGTVAAPRMQYNFEVKGQNGTTQTLGDSNFMPHKLCESNINLDVNGDGTVSPTTCLDISHYEFPNVQTNDGTITVSETAPPPGFHFGALRFTPTELSANNDKNSLVSIDSRKGVIKLNTSGDTDKMIMLHVYNFHNPPQSDTGTTTTTTMPSIGSIGNLGLLVLPQTTFNAIFNATSTGNASSTTSSLFPMVNNYPTINGNYVDCNGVIDNDMGHHSTNPNDTDPAHHIGQNCPGGSPSTPGISTPNNLSQGIMGNFVTLLGQNNTQYVLVPLNGETLQKLFNYLFMMHH